MAPNASTLPETRALILAAESRSTVYPDRELSPRAGYRFFRGDLRMKRFLSLISLLVSLPLAQAGDDAPPTPAKPQTYELHGQKFTDDYMWLEGDDSDAQHMGKITPEVSAWDEAQDGYTRKMLDNLPGRKALEARLTPLMEIGTISAPIMRGNRYFYSQREGDQNQARVYMREKFDGERKLLLNPDELDSSGLTTISWYVPSENGKLMAYGTYRAGDENSTLHLFDVDGRTTLPLVIPGKVGAISWLPDNSGFVYRNLQDVKNPYSGQVMFHKMGTDVARDVQLFRQFTKEENEKLATTYGPDGGLSRDGKWLTLVYSTDTRNNDLWVADFAEVRKTGKVEKTPIVVGEAAASGGTIVNDILYMQTTLDAPNGRLVAVDLKNPSKANWKELVPTRKDAVIQSVDIAKDVIAVDYLMNASTTIELFKLTGEPITKLKLPGIGSAGVASGEDRNEAFVSFASYNYPPSIYRIDLTKPDAEPELWERPAVPIDPTTVDVKQEWYTSTDGTKISMFIIHKKGLKLDGTNPTILYGYGGFNISMTPNFNAPLFTWFEDGGVYAVANLRGGGEYGKEWHDSGRLDKKQNVFDDFASAAQFLIKSGYTNPSRLAVLGGSNGGLLTGTFVTQHPDLCAAAIVAVPLLDMLRYQDFLMGRYWVPEYGSAENKEQFEFISKYSPYQNIKKGTKYPAVLLTAGANDARVHPMHARKMAAALRAATASEKPILLWVDREAGHGAGKPLNLRVRDAADQRMFLMWQLGMIKG